MESDVKIGGYNLLGNLGWHIQDKVIDAPEIKTHTVEIPGRDGVVDYTNYLRGYAIYGNREITIDLVKQGTMTAYANAQSQLYQLFHGRKLVIIFSDDANWMYSGRVYVGPVTLEGVDTLKCKLTIDADPYKVSVNGQKKSGTVKAGQLGGSILGAGTFSGFFTGLVKDRIYIPCVRKTTNDNRKTVARLNIFGDTGKGKILFEAALYGGDEYVSDGRTLVCNASNQIQFSLMCFAVLGSGETYNPTIEVELKEAVL